MNALLFLFLGLYVLAANLRWVELTQIFSKLCFFDNICGLDLQKHSEKDEGYLKINNDKKENIVKLIFRPLRTEFLNSKSYPLLDVNLTKRVLASKIFEKLAKRAMMNDFKRAMLNDFKRSSN